MTHLTLFDPSVPRLFADPFFRSFGLAGLPGRSRTRWTPPVDVFESDRELRIEAELPGVPQKDISVRFHDGRLIIEGTRTPTSGSGQEADRSPAAGAPEAPWTCRERCEGRYHRSFQVPDTVDASRIRAAAQDGVLTVVLPKAEKALPREIEVSVR